VTAESDQYDQQETFFIKLTGGDKLYNLKIEHYEDIGPDSGS
jgi:hypothetical protein